MFQVNIDLEVMQEKKLPGGINARDSAGYTVVTLYAPIQHRGGVAIFY